MTVGSGSGRVRVVVASGPPSGDRPLWAGLDLPAGIELVAEGGDLGEALALVRRVGADVLVVDAGPETAAALGAFDPGGFPCRTVVVAPGEDDALLLAAVQAGATGFVTGDRSGPELGARLAEAIVAVHHGESVVPTRMLGPLLTSLVTQAGEQERASREASRLSARQREVLLLLASAATLGDMARGLGVSVYTVRSHVQELLRKLRVHSRPEAVSWAVANGVLDHLRREAGPDRQPSAIGA